MIDYEAEKEMGKRVAALFSGLPVAAVKTSLEELIDDYTMTQYGVSLIHEISKFKETTGTSRISIQPIANGRGVLISRNGFNVVKTTACTKCKLTKITLEELSDKDFEMEYAKHD